MRLRHKFHITGHAKQVALRTFLLDRLRSLPNWSFKERLSWYCLSCMQMAVSKFCTWCSKTLSSQHTIELLLLSWLLPVSIHVPMHMALCTSYELRHVACLHQHAWRCGSALRMEQADLLNCLKSTLPEHPPPHETRQLTHAFQASSRKSRQTPAVPFSSLRQRIAGRQPLA